MSPLWPVVSLLAASLLATVAGAVETRRISVNAMIAPRLVRKNHAGRIVYAVLGRPLLGALLLGAMAGLLVRGDEAPAPLLAALVGILAVGLAGAVDDLLGGQDVRGIRAHLASLTRGRPTTGILKLLVGVAGGVVVAILAGGGAVRIAASALLIAASTNVWNALDVRPGRALKWALIVLAPCLPVVLDASVGPLVWAAFGAAAALLTFDLLERGMLGDAGSNPLGFAVGTALALTLPTEEVVLAALAMVALQLLAETLTISRLIEATPPLRWMDGLGRRN